MEEGSVQIFKLLINIYLATIAANIAISCVLLYNHPTRAQKAVLFNWLALSLSTVMNGFFPENTFISQLIPAIGTLISQSILGFMIAEVRGVKFSWKPVLPFFLAMVGLSYLLSTWPENPRFEIYALPTVIGGVAPFFYSLYHVFKKKTSPFTMVQKLFIGTSVIMSLHYLDWPYFRTQPDLLMIGFLVAFGIYHVQSILIPMMANENTWQIRNADLENEVLKRVEQFRHSENINRMKDEFLSSVSHELRTPLNSIIGYSDLLLAGELDTQADRQSAYEAINRSSRMQLRIVDQLLDVSSLLSGKINFNPQRLDAAQLGRDILEEIRPMLMNKNIELKVEIPSNLPEISADPLLLRQVCWNLLTNAIKFTNSGGWIRFSIRKIDDGLSFSVEDNGIGMSPSFLSKAFERFRQESSGNARQYGGLGLGLAICKELVDIHGGHIQAESDGPGKGSRFTFTIPFQKTLS